MATVALELAAAELVHRIPLLSRVLGRVTLDLASGMMETQFCRYLARMVRAPLCSVCRRLAMHATKLIDATSSPHLHHVASLAH